MRTVSMLILQAIAGMAMFSACVAWSDHPWKLFGVFSLAALLIILGEQIGSTNTNGT